MAALAGGPAGWGAPFDYAGEYPAGVGRVGAIPTFLREFPDRLPDLPSHATGHPAGAMVVYALVARVWSGLTAAALVTVAIGSLGAVAAGGLARDELGERGGRLALAVWVVAPGVVLYLATSADAVFAAVLGAAALAAHRGLVRRSPAWTVAGGALLWAASMLTYAAVLLLVFLGVRAAGRLGRRAQLGAALGRRDQRGRGRPGRRPVAGHRLRRAGRGGGRPRRLPGRSRVGRPVAGPLAAR